MSIIPHHPAGTPPGCAQTAHVRIEVYAPSPTGHGHGPLIASIYACRADAPAMEHAAAQGGQFARPYPLAPGSGIECGYRFDFPAGGVR